MDTSELLALYDAKQRISIAFPGVRREPRPHLIRYVSETGGLHFILYSQLAGADVEAVIAEEQAYFAPRGEVEWKVYVHDQPADLRERLAARGFKVDEPDAIMVLDLEASPRDAGTVLPAGVTVRRLDRADQLDDVRRIENAVWNEDFGDFMQMLAADLAVPGYLSVYLASVDGQPAAAGWIYFHLNSRFAGLWGGSTLAEHRGRGLYSALLAARRQEAAARGYRFLTVDASPMSRPIVERNGFRLLTTAWACTWRHTE
jgi:hypothetical protein